MNRNYHRSVSFAIVAAFALMSIGTTVLAEVSPELPPAVPDLTKQDSGPDEGAADVGFSQPGHCNGATVVGGFTCASTAHRFEYKSFASLPLCDDCAYFRSFGFSFQFGDQSYSGAYMCSNGYLRFDSGSCPYYNLEPGQEDMQAIFGFAHDMDPGHGGSWNGYQTTWNGQSAFVAQWYAIRDYGTFQRNYFQIVLFPSGNIEISLASVSNGYDQTGVGVNLDLGDGGGYMASSEYASYRNIRFIPAVGLPDPPTACFGHDAGWTTYTGDLVRFTNCSRAGDAPITSTVWTFGDGSQSSVTHPSKTYADDGSYTVCLTVTDANGLSDTTCRGLTIYNRAPVASFDLESTSVITNVSPITLRDTSTDADGEVVSRRWYVGFGYLAQQDAVVELDPLPAGRHYICVIPKDDDGQTRSACRFVDVVPVLMDGHGVAVRNTNGTAQFNVTNTYEQRSTVGFDVTNQSLAYEDANVTVENATATTTAMVGQVDTTARLGYLRALLPNGQTLEAFGVEAKAATNCYEDSGSTSFQTLLLDGVPINVNPLDIAPNTRIVLTEDTALVLNKQMPGLVGMTTTAIVIEHPDQTMTGIGYADAGISGCPYEFRA